MELPPALAPWGPLLGIFPPELALSLGPLLQRLAAAVGPLRSPLRDGDGEVDGFDGLARRGSYERLLVSEWLLAEEAPEEFLRRAAAGEHTFLRLARPEPAGSRRSAVLFDAGPGQLGSPRIAQLAALIVLARRAEAADARFSWGVLQRPDDPLQSGVTIASVFHLLGSRTPYEAAEAHVDAWSGILKGWKDLDDLWIVGSPGLCLPAALRISRLEIRDILEPGVRRLAVAVRRGDGPGGELALELPPDAVCTRLLRDPFTAVVAPPAGLSPAMRPDSNLLFTPNGQRLLARARDGGILALPVPNSPRASRKPPALLFPSVSGGLLVAAGAEKSRVTALIAGTAGLVLATSTPGNPDDTRGQLYVTGGGGKSGATFEVRSKAPLQPIFRYGERLFALDAGGSLFRLIGPSPYQTRLVYQRVLAARQIGPGIILASTDADGCLRFVSILKTGESNAIGVYRDLRPAEVFFGCGGRQTTDSPGLAAVLQEDEWVLFHGRRSHLRALSGTRVVGVATNPEHSPGLLLLEEDGRTLGLVGRNWSKRLLTAGTAVEQVAVSSLSPTFAYSTVTGEVTIASILDGTVFARWLPEEG